MSEGELLELGCMGGDLSGLGLVHFLFGLKAQKPSFEILNDGLQSWCIWIQRQDIYSYRTED